MMASHDVSGGKFPKESFWKRSRHTLGEKYFAFLKETKDTLPAEPETMNVAGDISPDAESNANAKRRAQIRRSQRWSNMTIIQSPLLISNHYKSTSSEDGKVCFGSRG